MRIRAAPTPLLFLFLFYFIQVALLNDEVFDTPVSTHCLEYCICFSPSQVLIYHHTSIINAVCKLYGSCHDCMY